MCRGPQTSAAARYAPAGLAATAAKETASTKASHAGN